MAETEFAVVRPSRTTTNLLRALAVTLAVIVLAVATLSYAYLRVARQLDASRRRDDCQQHTIASLSGAVSSLSSQADDNAVVLGRLNELASAFASLGSADAAVREQARQRLAALAAQPPVTARPTSTTSPTPAPPATTATTRPPATTSTTHHRLLPTIPTIPKLPLLLAVEVDPCTTATTRGSP